MADTSELKHDLFLKSLAGNTAGLPLSVTEQLVRDSNGRAVVASSGLELMEYASLGLCELFLEQQPRADHYCMWGGEDNDQLVDGYNQVVWRVNWHGYKLHVVHLPIPLIGGIVIAEAHKHIGFKGTAHHISTTPFVTSLLQHL